MEVKMKKLFYACTEVDRLTFKGFVFKGVEISWYVEGRPDPVIPYEKVIKDYEPNHEMVVYSEMHIREYFTWDEVNQLKIYLKKHYQSGCTIKEAPLPIDIDSAGYGAIPVGGSSETIELAKREFYDLPYPICGYVNVMHHEGEPKKAE